MLSPAGLVRKSRLDYPWLPVSAVTADRLNPLTINHTYSEKRLNGGYWSVTSRTA
jgi:hypothetical protein